MRLALAVVPLLAAPLAAQRPNLPLARPEPKHEVEVTKNVMVPMRDGVRLATDVYRPRGVGGKLPVVLVRLPYDKERYGGARQPAQFFAGHGYAVVVQDVRGQHQSEGEYRVQLKDSDDGWDTTDWIVRQPWSSGRVGTYGCSYLGEVQLLLAKRRHPAHKAMIAQSAAGAMGPAGKFYVNFGANDGGAFLLSSLYGWFTGNGLRVKIPRDSIAKIQKNIDFNAALRSLPVVEMARRTKLPPSDFEDYVSHGPADPYWDAVGYLRDDDRFDVPTIHVNSWLDVTPEPTMYLFNLMRKNSVSATARENIFAIVSPTQHCASEVATEHTKVGDMDVGDARFPYFRIYLDFFDHWLKGVDNGVEELPKVQYYTIGTNDWHAAPTWPVPGMRETSYWLTSGGKANSGRGDGRLTTTKPSASASDTYVYDPMDPFPSRGGAICCTGNPKDQPGIFDQADLEQRRDLLVYTTPPLERGLTITGNVRVELFVSSDARDTDFAAKLVDVDPEGRAWNISNGILRARYREGFTKKVLMEKGKTYPITVSLKATSWHFKPGHRVRLYVMSSDFPQYDRNLNTGGNNFDESHGVPARNTIHHGGATASRLVLPVVR
jgi:putative CocE/NonD family hydrolase